MAPGRAVWRAVKARFGPEVLAPDGSLDRRRLGSMVFEDPAALRFLNRLIHPLVMKEQARLIKELAKDRPGTIFICEAALVFEARLEKHYDRVIAVRCRRELQLARVRERQGLSRREALARIKSQLPQSEKARRADYVIDTSGTMAETVEQVERLYAGLMQDASLKALGMKFETLKKGVRGSSGQ
jgi:dephospho-CoA kinase